MQAEAWYLEPVELYQKWLRHNRSIKQLHRATNVPERTLRRHLSKLRDEYGMICDPASANRLSDGQSSRIGGENPGCKITDDSAVLIGRPNPMGTASMTPEELFEAHGLDPNSWEYSPTLNRYDVLTGEGGVTTLSQLKIVAKRRINPETFVIGIKNGWTPPPARKRRKTTKPEYTFVFPDPHAPLNEPTLTEASVALLEELQPSRVICLGDAGDNSPFGRHRKNPRTDCTVEESVSSTYELLARWRNAAPDAGMDIIPGNHDWWLQCRVMEMFPHLMNLKRPGEDFSLLNMRSVLALDSLGITLHDRGGEYHDNVINIADDLMGLHGTKTGKHGGAAKEQDGWEGASIVQGHDHKTAMVAITKRLPGGGETQRYAFSAGTMARRDLGYDPKHNCNQSFMVFTIWPDGRWHPEFALYDPQRDDVTWRDWLYA